MPLLADCETYFGTKNLYEVLKLKNTKRKPAKGEDIKKAYYRLSLDNHPDRLQVEDATQRFQTLNKVYSILSDEESRKVYDETGIVDDDDSAVDFCDLVTAFKRYFRVVTKEEMDQFYEEYRGSESETLDAKVNFERAKGDMNVFYEYQMCSDPVEDEERFRDLFTSMIEKGEVEAFPAFVKETDKKRAARKRKWLKEREEAECLSKELGLSGSSHGDSACNPDDQLSQLIRSRNQARTDGIASMLEQKYAKGGKGSKKAKT